MERNKNSDILGDVLDINDDLITINTAETEARKKKVADLVDDLFD